MKHQQTIAKLPFAKEVDEFVFTDTPLNDYRLTPVGLVRWFSRY